DRARRTGPIRRRLRLSVHGAALPEPVETAVRLAAWRAARVADAAAPRPAAAVSPRASGAVGVSPGVRDPAVVDPLVGAPRSGAGPRAVDGQPVVRERGGPDGRDARGLSRRR